MYSVYRLINPLDNSTFYVGVTNNIKRRFSQHLRDKKQKEKYAYIKSIGQKPIIEELKNVDNIELAEFIESEYIDLYKFNGYNLYNKNNGGNNPPSQSGKVFSEERKRKCFEISVLKKRIVQLDKNNNVVAEFEGAREAGRITGIDHRSISQVASGSLIRKSAGGYKWKYKQ